MRLIDADEIRIKPEYMHDICGSVMIRVEDVARIINEMPTINSQSHWTPCSEKMPNLSQEVLMSDEFDTVRVGSLEKNIDDYLSGDYYWEDSHGYLYDVEDWVAWMPLPKSYKLNRKNR